MTETATKREGETEGETETENKKKERGNIEGSVALAETLVTPVAAAAEPWAARVRPCLQVKDALTFGLPKKTINSKIAGVKAEGTRN